MTTKNIVRNARIRTRDPPAHFPDLRSSSGDEGSQAGRVSARLPPPPSPREAAAALAAVLRRGGGATRPAATHPPGSDVKRRRTAPDAPAHAGRNADSSGKSSKACVH